MTRDPQRDSDTDLEPGPSLPGPAARGRLAVNLDFDNVIRGVSRLFLADMSLGDLSDSAVGLGVTCE